MSEGRDPFGVLSSLGAGERKVQFYDLSRFEKSSGVSLSSLPFSIKILLENLLRHCDGPAPTKAHTISGEKTGRCGVTEQNVLDLARWSPAAGAQEVPFMPARVILQDFTGVPALVDLAAMRSAVRRTGGDAARVNPIIPVDLVIDHSVQVDSFASASAFSINVTREFERNGERYAFLRWAQRAFRNFRVVPPGTGIVHQVNLEYLANVVQTRQDSGARVAFPDTLVGTDSHTTMINGLGVLGWGVGGIEAEACLLGQPYYMLVPEVVGFKLEGELAEGATATDLVLTVTEMLRKKGVVGKFVEFYGRGLSQLSLPDRATLGNMAPEYGATTAFFPVDQETLNYLRSTGRDAGLIELVERYTKTQGMFRTDDAIEPVFSDTLALDLRTVEACLAGPRRPQDRVPLRRMKRAFQEALSSYPSRPKPKPEYNENARRRMEWEGPAAQAPTPGDPVHRPVQVRLNGQNGTLDHGSVVISAITSCTNTSNPSVMIAAGLLAKKAVERGLASKPHVKTSLAPGSRVVTDYLKKSGLLPYLEALGFYLVGYGCTTCIGNSGPLPEPIATAVRDNDLIVAAVLSGNRNFEGRINPLVRASYLGSPPLVVAYALVGTVDIDLLEEPLGVDAGGRPVYLREIWPSREEVGRVMEGTLDPELFRSRYGQVFDGDELWTSLPTPEGEIYQWSPDSTYIREPSFFVDLAPEPAPIRDIQDARVLVLVGDSVTTDHISPAGSIPADSPAGQYLIGRGVPPAEFNSYGARRGNHEVMIRGTFGNIRLKNLLVPGTEGGWTLHFPEGEKTTIYDAALRYVDEGIPLIVIAGKDYGAGSSRDWAAKGTLLLGVKAVLAQSFERIHRGNLVGMGVLPLQFRPGESWESLGLTGRETYRIEGLAEAPAPQKEVTVRARSGDGKEIRFKAVARLDSPVEVDYYRHGGILPAVLRRMLHAG
ncbi:MAG: aconitate hydratase AcnA [Acidobacteria bacterium]|nr:aconitate hydratase AcnA [Acidobacteriota bacterium]